MSRIIGLGLEPAKVRKRIKADLVRMMERGIMAWIGMIQNEREDRNPGKSKENSKKIINLDSNRY